MPAISDDLFGASPLWPAGLVYTPDFIGADEESRLLLAIRDVPMHDAQYYEYVSHIAGFASDS